MYDSDMFDLNTDSKLVKAHDSIEEAEQELARAEHPLDSTAMKEKHRRFLDIYRTELDRQFENRLEMAIDADYYDSIQINEKWAKIYQDRGQDPIVYNVLFQTANWIMGTEKRARMDYKVLPRRKDEAKSAERKTALMKYLSDVNRSMFNRSDAFEDCVKVGVGWIENGIQDEDDGEQIYESTESWRNILWDSASSKRDQSDWRYQIRTKWIDEDVGIAFFPEREALIRLSAQTGYNLSLYNSVDGDEFMDSIEIERDTESIGRAASLNGCGRRRVRFIELWYRSPEKLKRFTKGKYKGQIFNDTDYRHTEEEQANPESLGEKLTMRMRVAIFTSAGMIYEGPSPYRHNNFPFTPIWGMRRDRDGMPYGIIRPLRPIQDGVNRKINKVEHILSTNKTVMDEGAVDDMELFLEEVSKADSVIVKKQGKDLILNADRDLAPAHLELMSRDIQMIQQVGGVTDELKGQNSGNLSGIAIQRIQDQGSVNTLKFFDNLAYADQLRGEKILSLIEQFMTDEKEFRITGEKDSPDFHVINDGLPENDITRTVADFVITRQDWRATIQQAAADQLLEMSSKMPPQVFMLIADLIIENIPDLKNNAEIVKRIRQATGMKDPNNSEPTPEEIQAQQVKAQQDAAQAEMFKAELADKQASASQKQAAAAKTQADADLVAAQAINERVKAQAQSMEVASGLISIPQLAGVADAILDESGWPQYTPIKPASIAGSMGVMPTKSPTQTPMQQGYTNA